MDINGPAHKPTASPGMISDFRTSVVSSAGQFLLGAETETGEGTTSKKEFERISPQPFFEFGA